MSKGSTRAGWIVAAGSAASALLGLGYVATTWCRYGRVADDVRWRPADRPGAGCSGRG